MRGPPVGIVAQARIGSRRRIVGPIEADLGLPPHPDSPRRGGGCAVSRRGRGARFLVAGRAGLRRARPGDARAEEPPSPVRERKALLGEADSLLLGGGGDDAAFAGGRGSARDAPALGSRGSRARLRRRVVRGKAGRRTRGARGGGGHGGDADRLLAGAVPPGRRRLLLFADAGIRFVVFLRK